MQTNSLLTSIEGFILSASVETQTQLSASHGDFCGFSRGCPQTLCDMGDAFKSPICHCPPPPPNPFNSLHKLSAGSASWIEVNGFTDLLQPCRLALHPCMGHIWSPGSTHNHSNKLGNGGSPTPALSTRPHHCVLEGTQSMLSRHPLSRLGVRGQHPHFTLPAVRRDDADWQQSLLQINPLTNPGSMFLNAQSEEDFQELRTQCSAIYFENIPILVFLTTYFSNCYLDTLRR